MGLHLPFLDLVAPESRDKVKKACFQNQGRMPLMPIEYRRLHRNGHRLPTETRAKPTWFDEEWVMLGICSDISQRVELERKTREAEKLGDFTKFASSIAHEIRNPLTTVRMNAQMLKDLFMSDERQKKLIFIYMRYIG